MKCRKVVGEEVDLFQRRAELKTTGLSVLFLYHPSSYVPPTESPVLPTTAYRSRAENEPANVFKLDTNELLLVRLVRRVSSRKLTLRLAWEDRWDAA